MYYVLHLICYMLHVICYMLRVMCYILHVTCYMLHVTCYMLHVTCYMLHVICYMLLVTALKTNKLEAWGCILAGFTFIPNQVNPTQDLYKFLVVHGILLFFLMKNSVLLF